MTGNYAANNDFFASSGVDNPPVHLLQDGVSGGNGVYAYSASSTFPNNTFQSSNYWVDVVFTTTTGPTPLSVSSTTPGEWCNGSDFGNDRERYVQQRSQSGDSQFLDVYIEKCRRHAAYLLRIA